MLGSVAAGAVVMAAGAAAQDDAAFRTQMMARCATIADKSARLACYDAAQRGGPVSTTAPAGGPAPVAAGGVAAAPAYAPPVASHAASSDQFGLEQQRERGAKGPKEITARAVAATEDGVGYWTIQLEDGARWKLVELDQMFVPPAKDESVRIRRGAMGGYLMQVKQQPAVRVRRLD
jgi:hypothetical protein